MDKEVLEVILGSYLKILGEVSEIKRLLEVRLVSTASEKKEERQQVLKVPEVKTAIPFLESDLKKQQPDMSYLISKEKQQPDMSYLISKEKQQPDMSYLISKEKQQPDMSYLISKENNEKDGCIIKKERIDCINNKKNPNENKNPIPDSHGNNEIRSRNRSQTPFEPEKGILFDRFISQKERVDAEYDTIKLSQYCLSQRSQRVGKMSRISGNHSVNEESSKVPECNFFNLLEKEIEEML
ncbi:hypothetical protein GINT2_000244 [Glugoides intestinalis]